MGCCPGALGSAHRRPGDATPRHEEISYAMLYDKHLHVSVESSMILPLSRKRYKISMPGDEEDREIVFLNYIFTENKCLDGNAVRLWELAWWSSG